MKTTLATASKRTKTPIPFPCTHVTTWDIGNLRPLFIKRLKQGWKFDVDYYQTSRLQPLAQPTFGAFRLKTFAFWIPFHSVWPGYEQFISKDSDPTQNDKIEPFNFSIYELFSILLKSELNPFISSGSGFNEKYVDINSFCAERVDLSFNSEGFLTQIPIIDYGEYKLDLWFIQKPSAVFSNGIAVGVNLTARGRLLFNVLRGLGYEIPSVIYWDNTAGTSRTETFDPAQPVTLGHLTQEQADYLFKERYNIYPWLAFSRCIYDYVYPSAYVQKQGFGFLFDWNLTDTAWNMGIEYIFGSLLDIMFTAYDKDFFTTLWANPNSVAPSASVAAGNLVISVDSDSSHPAEVDGGQNNTSLHTTINSGENFSSLSANALRWLQAASDLLMRNNVGGTRFHEWLKAHFGLVDKEIKTRSSFLKAFTDDINFYPVTAAAGTESNVLGEQVGQGSSSGSGKLSFTAPCDGFLIYLGMLVPYIGYYQGNKPFVDALTSPYQFYTPEFDGVGFEGVPRSHIFSAYEDYHDYLKVRPQSENNPMGYALYYSNSEKRSYDMLTGNFRFNSKNTGLEGYHTFRNVLYGRNNLALDAQFLRVDNQYNRVFEQTDAEVADHIQTMFTFDCRLYADMLSLSESIPLFNTQGEKTKVEFEGTQI